MAEPAAPLRMSPSEYLAWERDQPDKHEYHEGEVFAMAGGSPRHNYLSARVASRLDSALSGRGCHVLSSDQRIAAGEERYVYADGVVVCGGLRLAPGTTDVLANPSILVEVFSTRTERYDRGDKWQAYQRLASVSDYLLVAQRTARVEHFRRAPDGWHYAEHGSGATIALANGATLDVDAIYDGAFDLPGD